MSTLKNIPIDFSAVVEKLNNFSNTKGFTMVRETKDGFVELKFYSSMSPGLLRLYNTKKSLTIDGSTGKNPKLNNKFECLAKLCELILKKYNEKFVWGGDGEEYEHYLFVIRTFLESNGLRYYTSLASAVEERKAGRTYTLSNHIRGLVYSMLTNLTKWHRI
ncbi:MAG TPA: hypothetical protein VFC41_06380 [Anaerovoracaceae bacterium]|nr:hypothetical protein [Anaerovoracaceae bacterium]